MTPLRQRFIDDLRLRNYARRTIDTSVSRVAAFAKHFGRSPDLLGPNEVRDFQLHLLAQHVSWSSFNQAVCALRFLYGTTLGRPEQLPLIPYGKRPKTLPGVLAPREVLRLIDAAQTPRDRVFIEVAYGCGLRLSELIHLRVTDIDRARLVIHARQGKGAKDRLVPLSPRLLEELRAYWRRGRPRPWLFPGDKPGQPISGSDMRRRFGQLAARAGLTKHCSLHTPRHSYATHLPEAGSVCSGSRCCWGIGPRRRRRGTCTSARSGCNKPPACSMCSCSPGRPRRRRPRRRASHGPRG